MSSLVAMIVLAYLLVIALCVVAWYAVSLRRVPQAKAKEQAAEVSPAAGERTSARRQGPAEPRASHDAYRGARASGRSERGTQSGGHAEAVPLFPTEREPLPAAPLHTSVPLDVPKARPNAIRVTDSKRTRERAAGQRVADEPAKDRATTEDAFERFLRANEDFER